MKALEVVILPVSDPDLSLRVLPGQLGFDLDVDYAPAPDFRVVQLTPRIKHINPIRRRPDRRACGLGAGSVPGRSRHRGYARTDRPRGHSQRDPAQGHRRRLARRFHSGVDPDRADYASFADFRDPDGNTWVLQERGYRNGCR